MRSTTELCSGLLSLKEARSRNKTRAGCGSSGGKTRKVRSSWSRASRRAANSLGAASLARWTPPLSPRIPSETEAAAPAARLRGGRAGVSSVARRFLEDASTGFARGLGSPAAAAAPSRTSVSKSALRFCALDRFRGGATERREAVDPVPVLGRTAGGFLGDDRVLVDLQRPLFWLQ